MKTRHLFAALALLLGLTGCWNRPKTPASDSETTEVQSFTFEELNTIFRKFGGNIMTEKFAPLPVKQSIEGELRETWKSMVEFEDACNTLSYDFYNEEGCADGFTMACYRYKADGKILVLLQETGGCDVSATLYLRSYSYDPEKGEAHEIPLPFEPAPQYEDFNDILLLAGGTVSELRQAMSEGRYLYYPDTKGVTVRLNTLDLYEEGSRGGFELRYEWDGASLVRDEDYPQPCIHNEGFAQILLGQHAPDFLHVGGDPRGYDIVYSPEGACYVISLDGKNVMNIQEDEYELVESIEVFSPRYSVQEYTYGEESDPICIGEKFNDAFWFGGEGDYEVWLFSDGTVRYDTHLYTGKISYTTTSDQLACALPPIPSDDVKVRVPSPKFKDTAVIKSIIVSKE